MKGGKKITLTREELTKYASNLSARKDITDSIRCIRKSIGTLLPADIHTRLSCIEQQLQEIQEELQHDVDNRIWDLYNT